MQRHGDVEVKGVVVDDTDCEEHCHHDHIVSGIKKERFVFITINIVSAGGSRGISFFYLRGIAGFFLPKFASKMNPSNAMNKN